MILPTTYLAALLLSIFTMLCWGSWANTQKLAGSKWRFELFYFDYSIGVVVCAVLVAFTFGTLNDKEITFLESFAGIALRKIGWAAAGGIVFNVSQLAISGGPFGFFGIPGVPIL